jgi:hypothetical protein
MIQEGLNPLVASGTALPGRLHSSEREIQVVVDHQDVFGPDTESL